MGAWHWKLDEGSRRRAILNQDAIKFGDGYEQIVSYGEHPTTWEYSVRVFLPVYDILAIASFLDNHAEHAFDFPELGTGKLVRVRRVGEYEIQFGAHFAELTATLRQNFR